MFNQVLLTLLDQKEDYNNLKKEVINTPLEKIVDKILQMINQDINKIVTLNQIEYIY